MESILLWLFIIVVVIQLTFYISFLVSYSSKPTSIGTNTKNIGISVIICAKNEATQLKKNIPKIIAQDFRDFEIILVNDGSVDDSLKVMEKFALKHPQIKVVNVIQVEKFWGNKKYALTLGIKAATKDYLVFTDADCWPASDQWLKQISSNFNNSKTIVLGYGAYQTLPKSFINKLIRFETVFTAIQYFSYAKMGKPYMGVGRNLAYRKDIFFNNSGFIKHMHLMSGDDDLFINEVATSNNTCITDHTDSFTYSTAHTSFFKWIKQKRRHISTSAYYKAFHKTLLALFYCSQLLFFLLSIGLLLISNNWMLIGGLMLLRYTFVLATFGQGFKKLNEKHLIFLSPLLEFVLVFVQIFIFIANLISKPKHWS